MSLRDMYWLQHDCPMYRCRICERFFRDPGGTQKVEGFRDQQLSLTDIVCADCRQVHDGAYSGGR